MKSKARIISLSVLCIISLLTIGVVVRDRQSEARAFSHLERQRSTDALMLQMPDIERFFFNAGFYVLFGRQNYSYFARDNYLFVEGVLLSPNGESKLGNFYMRFAYHEREAAPASIQINITTDKKSVSQALLHGSCLPTPGGKRLMHGVNKSETQSNLRGQPIQIGYPDKDKVEMEMRLPWPMPTGPTTAHYDRGYVDTFTFKDVPKAWRVLSRVFTKGSLAVGNPCLEAPGYIYSHPSGTVQAWLVDKDEVVARITIGVGAITAGWRYSDEMRIDIFPLKEIEPYLTNKDALASFTEQRAGFPFGRLVVMFGESDIKALPKIKIVYPLSYDVLSELDRVLPKENRK